MQLLPDRHYATVGQLRHRRAQITGLPSKINQKKEKRQKIMKKEVDGVVVEAKSILTALGIIKMVCDDNNCSTCPCGKIEGGEVLCQINEKHPNEWNINKPTDIWRALK
nr:MAG TPA: hypothetical protein [Caudoviricetes sp.]